MIHSRTDIDGNEVFYCPPHFAEKFGPGAHSNVVREGGPCVVCLPPPPPAEVEVEEEVEEPDETGTVRKVKKVVKKKK